MLSLNLLQNGALALGADSLSVGDTSSTTARVLPGLLKLLFFFFLFLPSIVFPLFYLLRLSTFNSTNQGHPGQGDVPLSQEGPACTTHHFTLSQTLTYGTTLFSLFTCLCREWPPPSGRHIPRWAEHVIPTLCGIRLLIR